MADMESASKTDLLHGYSFEISAKDLPHLEEVRPLVPDGTVVSITYLANESDAARIDAAVEVRRVGLVPMPHVSARRIPSAADLHRFLDALTERAQVDRLFVVAGDLPDAAGPFADALSVIEQLGRSSHGLRTVGIAGYPEGHPQISDIALADAMRRKLAALAELGLAAEVMTQFAFDAEPVVTWLRRLRSGGFDGLVRIGVPGPASVATLIRFAARCGVGASAKVMAKYGASISRLLNTAGPDRLYEELNRKIRPELHTEATIHLYPFGGLRKMAEWAGEASRS